jgi:P-type Ca2+ transporter type 2C
MIAGQVLIIMIGGRALQVVHLNGAQWGYSIVLGFLSIPVAIITRCVPDDAFQRIIPRRWWSQIARHGQVVSDGNQQTDWDSALLKVREEMELVSWVHGGRLHARDWRTISHRKPGLKPVAVMAGL